MVTANSNKGNKGGESSGSSGECLLKENTGNW